MRCQADMRRLLLGGLLTIGLALVIGGTAWAQTPPTTTTPTTYTSPSTVPVGSTTTTTPIVATTTTIVGSGPLPPKISDPESGDVSPHGGYSSASNYCLQCHQVHKNSTNAYSLLSQSSVTATCETCHSVGGSATSAPGGMAGAPGTPGTASHRSAYDLTGTAAKSQHGIGTPSVGTDSGGIITESDWSYGWNRSGTPTTPATTPAGAGTAQAGSLGNGLYCASCHTPHGDFGQAVNVWRKSIYSNGARTWQGDEGRPVYVMWPWPQMTNSTSTLKYLWPFGTKPIVWELCDPATTMPDDTTFATSVTNCQGDFSQYTATDAEGQTVSLQGYKLLSSYPNHQYGTVKTYKVGNHSHDTAQWCGTCHDEHLDGATVNGTTYHAHPTGCESCHGNPSKSIDPTLTASADFPHTSTVSDLLKAYPDGLCVSCHATGSLP